MLSYCVKCQKKRNISPLISKTKNGGTMILSMYVILKNQNLLKNNKQVEY